MTNLPNDTASNPENSTLNQAADNVGQAANVAREIQTGVTLNQPPSGELLKALVGKKVLVSFTSKPGEAFEHVIGGISVGHVKLDGVWRETATMRIIEQITDDGSKPAKDMGQVAKMIPVQVAMDRENNIKADFTKQFNAKIAELEIEKKKVERLQDHVNNLKKLDIEFGARRKAELEAFQN